LHHTVCTNIKQQYVPEQAYDNSDRQETVLSQGEPREAAEKFDTYRILH